MKKFIIGLLTGILLTVLSVAIFFFSLVRLGERRPYVPDEATLVLRLDGEIPEKSPIEVPIPFIGTRQVATVRDIWSMLRTAAVDKRIRAVVVMPDNPGLGWAKAEEIRHDLTQFRKSGKPVFAFLRRPRLRDYYVASAADRIYMSPEDVLDVKGLRAELMYFKRGLDKLGVDVYVQHVGKYKNAGEPFTNTTMSPETREVVNSVLDTVYGDVLRIFGAARRRSPEEMRAILDDGPFTAAKAKEKGLVDELRYEDQMYGELKARLRQKEIQKLPYMDYLRAGSRGTGLDPKTRIAFLVGEGTILHGSGGGDALGSEEAFTSGAFIRQVREVAKDASIRGVILRVDSPGGDAIASDEILREVKLLRDKKPLVISMSDAAASGGYYVSMTGDPMIAYPNTYTGSIGIVYGKLTLRGLYDKLGITKDIITRGRHAAIDSDYMPPNEAAKAKLSEVMDLFYREFVSKAAQSRRVKYEQLEPLAQGRVWMGSQAKANGLIDEIGGIDKAIEVLKRKAKIPAGEQVRLVAYPPRRTIFDQWLRSTEPSVELNMLRSLVRPYDPRLWLRGGIMRIAPYVVDVQ
ncbi:MAG TPA: signal peptide peptidase SppA [Bryobacteraceae bacterium]|nr:signal peptide peptidase SppA [Bryobacteraceae bacterium]